jgi:predicted enzyme involved in methoxymalonyl-ACP biosynthesis
VSISVLRDTKDLHMSRALELFNKTNQFNTTGARYTLAQCHQYFTAGRELHIIEAGDRFTHYGLIGAAWVRHNSVDHMVMSCRALGLGIEDSFLAFLADRLAGENKSIISGRLHDTDANIACRELYRRNGFTQMPDDPAIWSRPLAVPFLPPSHISLATPGDGDGSETSGQGSDWQLSHDDRAPNCTLTASISK